MQEGAIGYESPFVDARHFLLLIAEALENEGWPRRRTGALAAIPRRDAAGRDLDLAHRLLEDVKARPALEPLVTAATNVVTAAQRRVDSRACASDEASNERSRLGSDEEAWRQFCEAGRDGAITAKSDKGKVPPAAFKEAMSTPGAHQRCRMLNTIGDYPGVRLAREGAAQFWRPAPSACPEEVRQWTRNYGAQLVAAGRKVTESAFREDCQVAMKEMGLARRLKWREIDAAYKLDLPAACKFKPRGRAALHNLESS